jgi:hypothetical protein
MAKVHKSPWTVWPIVSVSGSITHGLGCWLDQQLKPIVRQLPSYIESLFNLKRTTELTQLKTLQELSLYLFLCGLDVVYQHQQRPCTRSHRQISPNFTALCWRTTCCHNPWPQNSDAE